MRSTCRIARTARTRSDALLSFFDQAALKKAGFKPPESRLIVQALKSLGQEHVTPEVISTIRAWLGPNLRARVLADTETATGWVYATPRRIAGRDTDGGRLPRIPCD